MPYPLDLVGNAPTNLITNELHVSTEQNINNHYYIFPEYISFYKDSLVVSVYNGSTWTTLTPNVDYVFKCIHLAATRKTSRELYGFIELINPTPNQTISLTYQTLGGSIQPNVNDLINIIIDKYKDIPIYILDVLTTDFDPNVLVSIPDYNDYPNTKGELEVTEKLHDIANKLATGYTNISNLFRSYIKPTITQNITNVDFSGYVNRGGDQLNNPFNVTVFPANQNNIVNKSYVENAFNVITTAYNNLLNTYNNKLSKLNPVANNPLYLSIVDTANTNTALTKDYVDTTVSPSLITNLNIPVGTIIQSVADNTPPGYLRCNGAAVSKTTYSDLYNVIGDAYAPLITGGGIPWQSQYWFNQSIQNDITGWTNTNSLITATIFTASLVTKNYIYILGGYNGSTAINTIQRASFDSNGNLTSTWSNVGTLPVAMRGMGYVTNKGRFYVIGGYYGSLYDVSIVYSAPINNDGTLGIFRAETTLPDDLFYPVCFVIKDKLYVVGGYGNSGDSNIVYQTTINNDGGLNNWVTLPNFPISFSYGKSLIIKDRVYIFGPKDDNGPGIYYTKYNSNGNISTWNYYMKMPNNIFNSAIICTNNYVFSIGGFNTYDRNYTDSSYCAPILSDGNIGPWTQINNGPIIAGDAQLVIVGNKIYFIGGYNYQNGHLNTVYSATFTSGITDYTPYYTDQQYIDPNNFYLPDYYPDYKSVENYYIKY
jgi:hypothetical protein